MPRKSAKEMAMEFADWASGHDHESYAEFAEELCRRTHRTNQQSAFQAMLYCIKLWAKHSVDQNFDLRNEATVKLSEKIWRMFFEEFSLPHF